MNELNNFTNLLLISFINFLGNGTIKSIFLIKNIRGRKDTI